MNLKVRAELLSKTEQEIQQEMATALGRIGRKLEELTTALRHVSAQMANGDHEPGIVQHYEKIRNEARLYYYYLIVQRESIGLTNHELLPKLYPIPPDPRKGSNRNRSTISI